jgi:uncharacterized delta-60 repeat protein
MGSGGSGSAPRVGGIALQTTGGTQRVVIAGDVVHCTAREVAVVGLNATGIPDASFGSRGDGRVFVDVAAGAERIYAMALDSAGRILLGGRDNVLNHAAVVRLTSDGLLDASFGEAGATRLGFDGLNAVIFNITTDASDNIIAVGGARLPGTMESDAFAIRLLPDGSLDAGFGASGALLVRYPVGNGDNQAGGVVVQSNGRIVVAGRAVFNSVVLMGLVP